MGCPPFITSLSRDAVQKIDEARMRLALAEAEDARTEDEVPVGAVVVLDGKVISRGHNRTRQVNDPTSHAEMLAVRSAAVQLQSWRLDGCTIYVTLEPCAMCAGALVLARVSRLVFGAWDLKTGACGSLRNVVDDRRLNNQMEIQGGVLEAACRETLKEFFRQKRKKEH